MGRTASQFTDQLAVHVNYLNQVLKETTGLTTTKFITGRILEETKILLRQTDRTLAEIAYHLGFVDVSHLTKVFVNACKNF